MASKKRVFMEYDISGWRGAVNNLTNESLPRATREAFGRTYLRIKSQLAKSVAGSLRVPQKHIRNRTRLVRAKSKPFEAMVQVERMPISAHALNARQTRFGVVARGGHKWKSAFIANPSSRNTLKKPTSFQRYGPRVASGSDRRPWYIKNPDTRYQRIQWLGIDVAKPVHREIKPVISRVVADDFPRILQQRVRYWSRKK